VHGPHPRSVFDRPPIDRRAGLPCPLPAGLSTPEHEAPESRKAVRQVCPRQDPISSPRRMIKPLRMPFRFGFGTAVFTRGGGLGNALSDGAGNRLGHQGVAVEPPGPRRRVGRRRFYAGQPLTRSVLGAPARVGPKKSVPLSATRRRVRDATLGPPTPPTDLVSHIHRRAPRCP